MKGSDLKQTWGSIRKMVLEIRTELARRKHVRLQRQLQDMRVRLGEVCPVETIQKEFQDIIDRLDDEEDEEISPPRWN